MSANDIQHGGSHYKTAYEHWDWAIDMNMGPLEYAATKYVSRWWKKGGVVDLQKPSHYIEKIIEVHENPRPYMTARDRLWNNGPAGLAEAYAMTRNFCQENKLTEAESLVCWLLASWTSVDELRAAQRILGDLAADPKRAAGGRAAGGQGGTGPAPAPAAGGALRGAGGQPAGRAGTSAPQRSGARPIRDGMEHPFGFNAGEEGIS